MAQGLRGWAGLPPIKGSGCSILHVLCQVNFLVTWWDETLGIMLTDLENAMDALIDVYHKYSLVQGNAHALYRDDLKKLLENEGPRYLKIKDAESWFKELDINSDNAINFEEFLILVIKMGVIAHEDIHQE